MRSRENLSVGVAGARRPMRTSKDGINSMRVLGRRGMAGTSNGGGETTTGAKVEEMVVKQRTRRGESTVWTVMAMQRGSTQGPGQQPEWRVAKKVVDTSHPSADPSNIPLPASPQTTTNILHTAYLQTREKLAIAFLPKGYPHSITPDYTPYTLYSFLHSVTGTLTGTLSTQALLLALGMSASTSAGLAATTNWIIKDGFGLLGGVVYAALTANRFDSSPKRYRFLAAVSIQLATIAELLTPLVPHLFIPLAGLSNICKNIGWLAASATKASMHKGFTREDNLGDVTAKAGAQATAAGLVGTGGGVLLSWCVGTEVGNLMGVFVPLCAVNLWCAYRANESVVTRSINLERGEGIVSGWLRGMGGDLTSRVSPTGLETNGGGTMDTGSKQERGSRILPTPQQISPTEHFIYAYRSVFPVPLALEPSLKRRLDVFTTHQQWERFLSGETTFGRSRTAASEAQIPSENYRLLIAPGPASRARSYIPRILHSLWKPNENGTGTRTTKEGIPDVHVCCWYTEHATAEDILKGFYHACVVRALVAQEPQPRDVDTIQGYDGVVVEAYQFVEETFEDFMASLKGAGWDVGFTHLGDRNARLRIG
ncbi:vitamin B6 photo-protection and homoeostasis-domain-containing protein [Fimicolochytrium jonesii]|uniref:vitamin B6 photo-protection and homoeostasis-domain-containing protein n=1 Tax=Fimicolochytrium jonesii TaxID=1396493 RepID=UPI0022FE459E|nr:vitamin B6 photo-protection and homoeostasis-domain-containing protein [Fimicolochytrium jonesii]KAI8817291.1 vitamin B6 photo-protection and homoeostasis-domain-containing protein [Fimicolochytrium jonesii]